MWDLYLTKQWDAQVSVYQNLDGLTRDNMRVDDAGTVRLYDKSRKSAGLSVDIGFLILKRDVLSLILEWKCLVRSQCLSGLNIVRKLRRLSIFKPLLQYWVNGEGSGDGGISRQFEIAKRKTLVLDYAEHPYHRHHTGFVGSHLADYVLEAAPETNLFRYEAAAPVTYGQCLSY